MPPTMETTQIDAVRNAMTNADGPHRIWVIKKINIKLRKKNGTNSNPARKDMTINFSRRPRLYSGVIFVSPSKIQVSGSTEFTQDSRLISFAHQRERIARSGANARSRRYSEARHFSSGGGGRPLSRLAVYKALSVSPTSGEKKPIHMLAPLLARILSTSCSES